LSGYIFGGNGVEALLLKRLNYCLIIGIPEIAEKLFSLFQVIDKNFGFSFDINDFEIV